MKRKRFEYLKYCLISTALSVPGLTGLATYLAFDRGRESVLRHEGSCLATAVWRSASLPSRPSLSGILSRLQEPGAPSASIRADWKDLLASLRKLGILRLDLIDEEGLVLLSTMDGVEGKIFPRSESLLPSLLAEGVKSELVQEHSSPSGDSPQGGTTGAFLEVWTPLPSELIRESGVSAAAIVLRRSGASLVTSIDGLRRRVLWGTVCCMLGQVAVFVLVAFKVDSLIRTREDAILDANQKLQELSKDLEHQVEERTRQLIQQEKLASLGTLAAGVAHEINNPLATISTCIDGCISRLGAAEPTAEEGREVKEYLDLVNEEVFQCKQITQNLLEFSRQSSVTELEPLDVNELVAKTIQLIKLGAEARGVFINMELTADSSGVYGDATQIRQVIFNLVQNSLAALSGGKDPHILARSYSDDQEIHLECIDNGPGVPPDLRRKVFEPFFTTKAPGEGTGLGLAVSYSIARRHGGELSLVEPTRPVHSPAWDREVGARFRFTLPRQS